MLTVIFGYALTINYKEVTSPDVVNVVSILKRATTSENDYLEHHSAIKTKGNINDYGIFMGHEPLRYLY